MASKTRTQKQVIDSISSRTRRELRKYEDETVGKLLSAYRRAYDDMEMRLMAFHSQWMQGEPWDFSRIKMTRQEAFLWRALRERITDLENETKAELADGLVHQYLLSSGHTSYMLDQITPPNVDISLAPMLLPDVQVASLFSVPWKGARFSDRVWYVTEELAANIQNSLTQSMILGEGIPESVRRLKGEVGIESLLEPEGAAYKMARVARTEILRASDMAREAVFNANDDIIDDSEWVATADDRVCDDCAENDGKLLSDLQDEIPLHPNCRCSRIPHVKTWKGMGIDLPEWEETDRVMRDASGKSVIVPVEKAEEWFQRHGIAA